MRKIISVAVISIMIAVNYGYAYSSLEKSVKNLHKMQHAELHLENDIDLRKRIFEYIEYLDYDHISLVERRLANTSAHVLKDYLDNNYKNKGLDVKKDGPQKEKFIYRKSMKIIFKHTYAQFYACYPGNEEKVKDSIAKTKHLMQKRAKVIGGIIENRFSEEVIGLTKAILEECKYGSENYYLLDIYRIKGELGKYNNLMLQILDEDQVNYDYMYNGFLTIDSGFQWQYIWFISNVNSRDGDLLSSDDIEIIASLILNKHYDVFDISKGIYYDEKNDSFSETNIDFAIHALINVSYWLRGIGSHDLNKQIINKFFKNGPLYEYLKESHGLPRVYAELGIIE